MTPRDEILTIIEDMEYYTLCKPYAEQAQICVGDLQGYIDRIREAIERRE